MSKESLAFHFTHNRPFQRQTSLSRQLTALVLTMQLDITMNKYKTDKWNKHALLSSASTSKSGRERSTSPGNWTNLSAYSSCRRRLWPRHAHCSLTQSTALLISSTGSSVLLVIKPSRNMHTAHTLKYHKVKSFPFLIDQITSSFGVFSAAQIS